MIGARAVWVLWVSTACASTRPDINAAAAPHQDITSLPYLQGATLDLRLDPVALGDDEVEIYSAALTAAPCALRARDRADLALLASCAPIEAARDGFAVFDLAERAVYLLKPGTVMRYQLEQGFGGSIDVSGHIVGAQDGVPVIEPSDYHISPRAKAGAFKGCL